MPNSIAGPSGASSPIEIFKKEKILLIQRNERFGARASQIAGSPGSGVQHRFDRFGVWLVGGETVSAYS